MRLIRQFMRFAVIGGVGFAVDVGLLYLLIWAGTGPYLGRLISLFIAATVTWQGNRRFTFNAARKPSEQMRREWAWYVAAMIFGGAVNYGIYAVLITWSDFFLHYPVLAVVVSTAVSMLVNFTSARWILHEAD